MADRYYKTMTTYKQLVFMLYRVITKAPSLNSLCKSLLFLDGKLSQIAAFVACFQRSPKRLV